MELYYICWIIALFIMGIGIITIRSKKPTGIYSNIKPPDIDKIKDLKAYNKAVGMLLIGYAILIFIVGLVLKYLIQSTSGNIILIILFPGAIIMMVIYELVIVKKYIYQ